MARAGIFRNRPASRQRNAAGGEQGRESLGSKKSVLALALYGQRIEPCEFGVNQAGMAHDESLVRQPVPKIFKKLGKVGSAVEDISPGECRVGAHAQSLRATPELPAQDVEQQRLRVCESLVQWQGPAALTHPGVRRCELANLQHSVAHHRKYMHMLVTIDKIGRTFE